MLLRLEKIDHRKNQQRYYALSLAPTLFGEWSLLREWGRIGRRGGRIIAEAFETEADAAASLTMIRLQKERHGYCSTGFQLELPF